jgi:hypothetical protein
MSFKDRVISRPRWVYETEYRREFNLPDTTAGYSFTVNADGTPIDDEHKDRRVTQIAALVADDRYTDAGVVEVELRHLEYGRMKCDCGHVHNFGFGEDVSCDHCGREYNAWGQQLADRRFWGEETGETPTETQMPMTAAEGWW